MEEKTIKEVLIENGEDYEQIKEYTKFKDDKEKEQLKFIVQQKLLLKETQEATEQIVKYIEKNNEIKSIREDDKNEIWMYREGIYIPHGKSYIEEICREIFGVAHTTYMANQVIAKIQADTYVDKQYFFNQQNDYKYLIPVQNGILNIKTRELKPFNKDIFFFNKLPVKYNNKAKCPNIIKFFNQITRNKDDVLCLQEIFGFSLLKDYKFEKAVMFYGKNGRNGKGKTLELLKRLLGEDNTKGISLQDLEKRPFIINELHNKLVNISGDLSPEAMNHTGMFKQLTGRDTITADRKMQSTISFVNYAKMIFACNEMPNINTTTKAFWLRWIIIEFPYTFLPQKELNALSDEDKKNAFLQDPTIIDRISTSDELEGLLNFALEGLHRLEVNKDFSNKETAAQTEIAWKRKSNSVLAFLIDNVNYDYNKYISKEQIKNRYLKYCIDNKLRALSDKVIKITIENEFNGYEQRISEKDVVTNYVNRVLVWKNISFKYNENKVSDLSGLSDHSHLHRKNNLFYGNEIPLTSLTPLTSKRKRQEIVEEFVLD